MADKKNKSAARVIENELRDFVGQPNSPETRQAIIDRMHGMAAGTSMYATHIPDVAVQAALIAFENTARTKDGVIAAIIAALPYLSAPCAVEVKKLEWTEHANLWRCDKNPEYQITRWWLDEVRKQGACFEVLEIGERQLGTLEEAKAAAQADFERRILSSVVTKPVDVVAVRNSAALNEINKFVIWFDRFICDQDELNSSTPRKVAQNAQDASAELKEAIRALSPAEPVDQSRVAQLESALTSILFEDSDKSEQQRMIDRVKARAVLEIAEPAQGDQWHPIDTAPKDGTEILAWREDCGWLIVSYTSLDAFPMTQSELDELDEETLFKKDWFTQFGQHRLEGSEVPTHWMPLPAAPTSKGGE